MSAWTPPQSERERLARIFRCVAAKAKADRLTAAEALNLAATWIALDDDLCNEDLQTAEKYL